MVTNQYHPLDQENTLATRKIKPKTAAFDLAKAKEYLLNRGMLERTTVEVNNLKREFMEFLEQNGRLVKTDKSEKRVVDFPEALPFVSFNEKTGNRSEKVVVGFERRRSTTKALNEERTVRLLKKKGIYEACLTTVVELDEDKIFKYNYPSGKDDKPVLSDAELDSLYDETEKFSFYLVEE